MKENKLKFGVIGSGSWGTALIKILCENNDEINWYVRNKDNIDFIYKNSFNPNYLNSVKLNLKKMYANNRKWVQATKNYGFYSYPHSYYKELVDIVLKYCVRAGALGSLYPRQCGRAF